MNLIQVLNIDPKVISSEVEKLLGTFLKQDLEHPTDIEEEHRKLLSEYKALCKDSSAENESLRYETLNIVLRSALRCGDFLNLSTYIYKMDKEVEKNPKGFSPSFLASYHETSGVYHFYDNELQKAVCCLEKALESEAYNNESLERLLYYYLAVLIGAYLPLQADEVIQRYKQRQPVLTFNPLLWLVEAIVAVENHRDKDEVMWLISQMKQNEDSDRNFRKLLQALNQLLNYIDRKDAPKAFIPIFPEHWEQILRLDLWIQAKRENTFYYNLLTDEWQKKKRVF